MELVLNTDLTETDTSLMMCRGENGIMKSKRASNPELVERKGFWLNSSDISGVTQGMIKS